MFHIYLLMWVKFDIIDLHVMLLKNCGFRENWYSGARILYESVNESSHFYSGLHKVQHMRSQPVFM